MGWRLSRQEVGTKKGNKEAEWACRSKEKEVEVEVEKCQSQASTSIYKVDLAPVFNTNNK
jgi:hypothetical protein